MLSTRFSVYLLMLTAALAGMRPGLHGAQSANTAIPLTVEEVVRLSKAGFSEELIITKIKKNGKAFDLSTDELVELKRSGVSENVVKFLLDPAQPYAPAPVVPSGAGTSEARAGAPPIPSAPAKQYPEDPYASKVPQEPGLYRFPAGSPQGVDLKLLLGTTEGAGLGKVIMKKGKVVAYLPGPASKTRITEPVPRFYLRLPDGRGIEEVLLLTLERKADRREIEMGPAGPKPELKAETIRRFDPVEIGARLFKITPDKLAAGEYLFFLMGSAEPPKGSYGKGYDFGVDAPPGKPR
jgi:hypothetical protein